MKKLILLIAFISLVGYVNAQTNVSGFINANTTWDLAGSPYIVTGNALLSHGYTLTIDPGVVIKFDTATALQIDGELIAIGTPTNRITFTSNKAVPQPGDWANLHFSDTCVSAVFDASGNYLSGCIMKNCDVLYGGGLGYGEIHIEGSSPYITRCNILNSSTDGIDCYGSSYILDSSAVKNCNGYGLLFNGLYNSSCKLKINGDTIENINNSGIVFSVGDDYCLTSITNNYFISNHSVAIDASQISIYNIVIADNYFINNTSSNPNIMGIIKLCDPDGLNYNDTIECNKFINNSGYLSCIWGTVWNGMIINNFFVNNSCENNIINLYYYSYAGGALFFSNNYFANNSLVSSGDCCYFYDQMVGTASVLHIDHNSFVYNRAHNTLHISCLQENDMSLNVLNFKYNSFSDPYAQYELYNDFPYGMPDIYADSNYWGSTSTSHIDSVIYDYFDYANLSVVYYSPILNAPPAIDTTCPPDIITGIKYHEAVANFNIFPNPATSNLTIETMPQAAIEILNIQGQLIKTFTTTSNKTNIDVSFFPSGVYVVEVKTEKGIEVKKFVKE